MSATDEQREHLRRIAACFAVVVLLLPLVLLGGWWALVLVPLLGLAVVAFVEAVRLRRSVRRPVRR